MCINPDNGSNILVYLDPKDYLQIKKKNCTPTSMVHGCDEINLIPFEKYITMKF